MCHCLSFLVTNPTLDERWVSWSLSLVLLGRRICSFLGTEVQHSGIVVRINSSGNDLRQRQLRDKFLSQNGSSEQRTGLQPTGANDDGVKKENNRDLASNRNAKPAESKKTEARKLGESMITSGIHSPERSHKSKCNGGSEFTSLFSQRGRKGINQDTMLVWEDFGAQTDTIFCGVFDGHGPHGHLVARNVRDLLPLKLASCWQALRDSPLASEKEKLNAITDKKSKSGGNFIGDPQLISMWRKSFLNAYKLMDRELLIDENVDCVSSGTTAVTLVKQGNHLIIGNVGDSRAILGVRTEDNSLLALQLTVDLKPNLPKEAERIRRCKGRVFALREEPSVTRVWLPHHNSPGLAMARALGDFSLKNFGVISVPQLTYRQLTEKDKFIVLATDGVWDVLSNEQVVEIVASCTTRSLAAKAVVNTAMQYWKSKQPAAKIDDCAVVCLFLDNPRPLHNASSKNQGNAPHIVPLQVTKHQSGDDSEFKMVTTTSQTINGDFDSKTPFTAAQNNCAACKIGEQGNGEKEKL